MFEFLGTSRGELSEKKIVAWNEFLKNEKSMLSLFDGTARGKVRVTKATELFSIGVYSISQLKAKIIAKLYSSDEKGLKVYVDQIENETLRMVISMELQKIRDFRNI